LVDSGKWNCESYKGERLCVLEEKLQNALIQIKGLKLNNRLEEQLRMAGTGNVIGRQVMVQEHFEGEQC
jgi:hypothetical protein